MCIVTRTVKDEADMIRFVRGPDGVVVPDLPGCISAGRTLDEAMHMAHEAIELDPGGAADARELAGLVDVA